MHASDVLTHQDKIYKHYLDKESWIRSKVDVLNRSLTSQNKPKIQLGLFDVLPYDIVYGDGPDVLLLENRLQGHYTVNKKFVEIPESIYGIYYMPDSPSGWHRTIDKEFNCFINRVDPVRQGWFYLLYDRGLLPHSYSSFSCAARPTLTHLSDLEYFDKIHHDTLSAFQKIYHDIKKIVPYKNFSETGNLCDTIMLTKFSIVIETYFERTDLISFSEKTFRVLQTPRPWILFHATNSINLLRNMGFYVYDDFIDHSYDMLDTTHSFVQRQEGMFSQIKNLMSLDVTPSMLDHWEKMTLKNCQILQKFNQNWKNDVEKSVQEAYNLAML